MYLFLNCIQGASRPEFRDSREVDPAVAEFLLVALAAFRHGQILTLGASLTSQTSNMQVPFAMMALLDIVKKKQVSPSWFFYCQRLASPEGRNRPDQTKALQVPGELKCRQVDFCPFPL